MKDFLEKQFFNILSVVLIVLFTAYAIHLYRLGMFSSLENFRNFILSKGKLAPLAFMLVNIIQVALPIIPGGPVLIFGVVIFGAFWGFIYNYLSICVGCIIVFIISKTFGKNAVIRIFGEDTYNKYYHKINDKSYERFLFWAILLPLAPDDLLCYLSGLTDMTLKKFSYIIIVCKGPSIILYSAAWFMGFDFIFKKFIWGKIMFYRKVILFYIPAYLIIIGFVSNKVKDKMNTKYGYRSELSMKNKANWYYANKTMAKMCFGLGGVFLLLGFLIARYMEVTLLRIAILWILEFLAYITGGILLERKLKTIHKK